MTAAEFQKRYGLSVPAGKALDSIIAGAQPAQIRLPADNVPNKTEAAYGERLAREFPDCEIKYEEISFRLPIGTAYTPDWTVWRGNACILAVEVKGGFIIRDASKEKFKHARHHFKAIKWRFAQQTGKGDWAEIQ